MNNITLQPEPTLQYLMEGAFNDPSDYIAGQILPKVPSETLTGYIGRLNEGALRVVSTAVKGLAKNVINFKLDRNATYEVGDHELENVISRADAERFGGWDQAKKITGALLADEILRSREHALASALCSTSIITNYLTLSGVNQWTTSTSEVLGRISTGKATIEAAIGKTPNVIICGAPTFRALQFHPQVISALSPGKNTPGIYNEAQFAQAFGVEKFIVGRAIYNSAIEGQTASNAFIWGDNLILAYVAPSALAWFSKTLGASIVCPSKAPEQYAHSYVPEGKKPEQVQVLVAGANWEDKVITATAAYLITDTNA